jgi:hypothetical protein
LEPNTLNKSIEAKKLNPRTGSPLTGPEVTVPFGALIKNISEDRGFARFDYLSEPYRCSYSLLMEALGRDKHAQPAAETAAPPVSAPEPQPAESEPEPSRLQWEQLDSGRFPLSRAKVPGGWLVTTGGGSGIAFYPDPGHEWDGSSLA